MCRLFTGDALSKTISKRNEGSRTKQREILGCDTIVTETSESCGRLQGWDGLALRRRSQASINPPTPGEGV